MTSSVRTMKRLSCVILVSTLVLGGCRPSKPEAIAAINAVNARFKVCYEETLSKRGTRSFEISTQRALTAMELAMEEIGMEVVESDRSIGYLTAVGPAPLPLDEWEWRRARNDDLPEIRAIIKEHVPGGGWFQFEPEIFNVKLTITIIEQATATDISATMRFEEIAPPGQGYPPRTYPPCQAMRMGLDKIWKMFEQASARYSAADS